MNAPIELPAPWLSCLVRLRQLTVQAQAIKLGSSCGQLAALQQVSLSCGWEVCKPEAYSWSVIGVLPGTVVVQPGSIPAGLISMAFRCCAMPELPAALSSATGLKCLQLDHATAAPRTSGSTAAPLLAPTLERFTGLETLQLWHLQLEDQQSLPALLADLTRLQHLDLSESPLCPGGEQVLCSSLSQLSRLTSLFLGNHTSTGATARVVPAALPNLLELRRILVPTTLTSACSWLQLRRNCGACWCVPPHCCVRRTWSCCASCLS